MKKLLQLLVVYTGRTFFLSLFILLIGVNKTAAQDSAYTQPAYPLGVFSHLSIPEISLVDSAGINYIMDGINDTTKNIAAKLLGERESKAEEKIFYYTKGYYTRWEAERNKFALLVTGFKHPVRNGAYAFGHVDDTLGPVCWATDNSVHHAVDSVLWGPDYRQDKYYTLNSDTSIIEYTAAYRMALDYIPSNYSSDDTVCALYIIYKRRQIVVGIDTTFLIDTLGQVYKTVGDFQYPNTFKTFPVVYNYPDGSKNMALRDLPDSLSAPPDTLITDGVPETGIEFQLKWYGIGKLYIDYVDLYDNTVWKRFIDNTPGVAQEIKSYADSLSGWQNLAYWYVNDEPNTIDSFTPMRIVDSIVTSSQVSFKKPLITEIYPPWNQQLNGDNLLQKFIAMANPSRLMIDRYNFWVGHTAEEGLFELRKTFQDAYLAQPGFWYVGQAFGQMVKGSPCRWRKPSPTELNASLMLALAHGSKGLFLWLFNSHYSGRRTNACGQSNVLLYFDGMLDGNGNPTDLYNYVKDDLSPRLKGALGKKLMTLNYTGDYLWIKHTIPTDNPQAAIHDYLTLGYYQSAGDMYWHAGFFDNPADYTDKYFLLANQWTGSQKTVSVKVTKPVEGYNNYRLRNIEIDSVDYTFTNFIISYLTHPAGEGYLYEVAPVVKYGGSAIVNDTLSADETLENDMVVKDGVELLNGKIYTIKDTVTLEGTGFITGQGYVYLDGGGAIITNRWDRSLFKSRSGDHPKLIFSVPPSITNATGINIYRMKGSPVFELITTLSDTAGEFIDTAVTIVTGSHQNNETLAKYYITYNWIEERIEVESTPSDTIIYDRVEGAGLWKNGNVKKINNYGLSQNYPNPFNPSTTITYSL